MRVASIFRSAICPGIVRAAFAALSVVAAGSLQAAVPVSVGVDANTVIRTIPENTRSLHTSVYANQMAHSSLDDRLITAGVDLLRYPGGSYSDTFHWSIPPQAPYYVNCCSTPPGLTQPHPFSPYQGVDPATTNPWPWGYYSSGSHFANFVRLLDASGTNAMITVNYGSSLGNFNASSGKWLSTKGGQPNEAAAWVAYANADAAIYGTPADVDLGVDAEGIDWKTAGYWAKLRASTSAEYQTWAQADGVYDAANNFLAIDRDNPVGIKYWEIGNEINGNGFYGGTGWEHDLHGAYDGSRANDVNLSPQTYGANLVQFSQAMKLVDPTIQIGGVMVGNAPGAVGNTSNINTNWDRRMLLAAGDAQVVVNGQNYDALDFGILHWYVDNDPAAFSGNCESGLAGCEANVLNATAAQLPGIFNELRNRVELYTNREGEDFPIHMTEFGYFDSIGTNNVVTGLFAADVYGTALEQGAETIHFLEMSSLFLSDNGSLTPQPAFRAFQMLSHFFDGGDELLDATTTSAMLKSYAVRQADGTLAIMMINLATGEANDAEVTIDVTGLDLAGEGTRWLWGSGQSGEPAQLALSEVGNNFTITVPDRTVMVLLIPEAEILAGDYNDDGVVDAADYTVWRNALDGGGPLENETASKGVVDQLDYDAWKANYGNTLQPGAGGLARAVPEPAGFALLLAGGVCYLFSRRQRRILPLCSNTGSLPPRGRS